MLAAGFIAWPGPPPHLASRCHAVHVEAINTAAAALYLGSGFAVESEETEAYARALNRNRRLLLHTTL